MMKYFIAAGLMALSAASLSAQVPLTGEGTQASPYLIKSAAEWSALASYVKENKDDFKGKFIRLDADIDLSGETFLSLWADNVTQMRCYFDGNGHRVSGISASLTGTFQGVFGTIGAEGTLANITLAGTISSKSVTSGAIVGRTYGTMSACINEVDITSTMPTTGGVAGRAFTGAKFIGCVNRALVSGTTNVGGIVATTEAGITFERCGNEGTITATQNSAAGIVAMANPSVFVDCYNKGSLDIKSTSGSYYAGIVAQASWAANYEGEYTFKGCTNTADIRAPKYVAGIVGTMATLAGNVRINLTDCHNSGNITSTATITSNYGAAGIAGAYVPLSSFTDCSNSGKITAGKIGFNGGIACGALGTFSVTKPATFLRCSNSGDVASQATANGGLVGSVGFGYTSFSQCSNSGNVAGTSLIGGLVGNLEGLNNSLTDCWNIGGVNASLNRVGGLFGANTKNANTVRNCWNAGDVVTTSVAAGLNESTGGFAIGGLGGISAAKFYNCFNLGMVKGMTQVGGIVGRPSRNMTGFDHCYNIGKIDAPAAQAGDLVGIDTSDTQQWSTANKATDCYYATDNGDNPLDKIGTASTVAALCELNMGTGFLAPRPYMLPLPATMADCDAAQLYTAMVIPAQGQSLESISGVFHVGNPEGIAWSADKAEIRFDGNDGYFTAPVSGEALLTGSLGDFSRSVKIGLDVTTGINAVEGDAIPVAEQYYTLDGRRLDSPARGTVCIAVRRYADGSVKATKELR